MAGGHQDQVLFLESPPYLHHHFLLISRLRFAFEVHPHYVERPPKNLQDASRRAVLWPRCRTSRVLPKRNRDTRWRRAQTSYRCGSDQGILGTPFRGLDRPAIDDYLLQKTRFIGIPASDFSSLQSKYALGGLRWQAVYFLNTYNERTRLRIARLPAYPDLLRLGRERKGAIFLDIPCCCQYGLNNNDNVVDITRGKHIPVGNDTRKAVQDGYPIDNVVASDLHKGERPDLASIIHIYH